METIMSIATQPAMHSKFLTLLTLIRQLQLQFISYCLQEQIQLRMSKSCAESMVLSQRHNYIKLP